MQQQQQQHDQQRSFYRANRPGNLNISNINENTSIPSYEQSPAYIGQQNLSAVQQNSPYMTQTSYVQNKIINSPLPPSLQSPYTTSNQLSNIQSQSMSNGSNYTNYPIASPSYNSMSRPSKSVYQTPNHQQYTQSTSKKPPHQFMPSSNYDNQASQSFTPSYSPCPSSAQIINKQSHYFTFDLNNNTESLSSNNNNAPPTDTIGMSSQVSQSPSFTSYNSVHLKQQQQQQQAVYPMPNSPHLIQTKTSPVHMNNSLSQGGKDSKIFLLINFLIKKLFKLSRFVCSTTHNSAQQLPAKIECNH